MTGVTEWHHTLVQGPRRVGTAFKRRPRGGTAGSGSTAPVGPITTDPFTTTTSSTLALAIALSVGTPRPPDEPEDECVPEPEGSEYNQADLDDVTDHLRDINSLTETEPHNVEMLRRIQSALDSGSELTLGQSNFMKHELLERTLYRGGMDIDGAHDIAGKEHKFGQNYDEDLVRNGWFNDLWKDAWC